MKKLVFLSLMISLFAFGNKSDVSIINAEEVVPVTGTSAMFFENSSSKRFLSKDELAPYKDNLVSIKISNSAIDLPLDGDIVEKIKIDGCSFTDAAGVTTTPEEGVVFAYLSEALDSTDENLRYDCVLYADADKIYMPDNAWGMFHAFPVLENIDLTILDTSKTTNMFGLFNDCPKLKNLDLSNFNTENVNDTSYMFYGCRSLTRLDLSNFNTSNVTTMASMFSSCQLLSELNISSFDTKNVKYMDSMFQGCRSLTELDLSHFETTNLKSMAVMFASCVSLTKVNLSKFDTSKIETTMYGIFYNCPNLKEVDLSSFDLSNVSNLVDFFWNCNNLEVIKAPKALPPDSMTNSDLAIKLPDQFNKYCGISEINSGNLPECSIITFGVSEIFVYNWRALRTDVDGICGALISDTENNDKLIELLKEYDAFDEATKTGINAETDVGDITIGESIAYVKNVLNGTQTTENDYGISKEDAGSFMTMSITEESPYLISLITLFGILSVIGYYFYNKKKQEM